MTTLSAVLSAAVSPWFLLLTGFVALNLLLFAGLGVCGASAILRGLGVRSGCRRMSALEPVGRLGRYAAANRRTVFVAWAVIAVALGFLAPRVETALSGAGWQANGSESVQVRERADRAFGGSGAYAIRGRGPLE